MIAVRRVTPTCVGSPFGSLHPPVPRSLGYICLASPIGRRRAGSHGGGVTAPDHSGPQRDLPNAPGRGACGCGPRDSRPWPEVTLVPLDDSQEPRPDDGRTRPRGRPGAKPLDTKRHSFGLRLCFPDPAVKGAQIRLFRKQLAGGHRRRGHELLEGWP